jgi:hypothetical protein
MLDERESIFLVGQKNAPSDFACEHRHLFLFSVSNFADSVMGWV